MEVSHEIRKIFNRYTPLVQPLSLDEAFLDVRGCERLFGDAVEIGSRIKMDIKSDDLPPENESRYNAREFGLE